MSRIKAKNPIKTRGNSIYFNFSHKGKEIRSATGYKVGQEDLAIAAYLEKRKELDDEANGIQVKRTIQDGLIRYIEEHVPKLEGEKTAKSHIKNARDWIDESRPLSDIYQVINEMINEMSKSGRFQNSTINKRASHLSGMATLAYSKWQWLKESPYKKIERLSEKKLARDIYILPEDIELLMNNCRMSITSEIILFAAYTGIRTAELWRLDDNSLQGNDLRIQGKGDKTRVIPLNEDQVIFIKNNIPITHTKEKIKEDFAHARDVTGLSRYCFHDLRHTFGTLLAKQGKPQYKIMKLMGHSTDLMARRYMNLTVDDLRDDMPKRPTVVHRKPSLKVVS